MESKATLSDYRQAPRKTRLVANLIKGKTVARAIAELNLLDKRVAPIMAKLINSAVANAKVKGMSAELYVKEFTVDKGMVLKRSMPRAFGRAFPIKKRTSHITVTIAEREGVAKKIAKSGEKAAVDTTETKEVKKKTAATKATKKPAAKAKKTTK